MWAKVSHPVATYNSLPFKHGYLHKSALSPSPLKGEGVFVAVPTCVDIFALEERGAFFKPRREIASVTCYPALLKSRPSFIPKQPATPTRSIQQARYLYDLF